MRLADLMPNVVVERFGAVMRSHPVSGMSFPASYNVKQAHFGLLATDSG